MLQVSVKLEVKTIIYDYIIHFLVAGALYFFHYHYFVRVFDSRKSHVTCTLDLSKVCICFHQFWRNISIIINTFVPKLQYINSQERKKEPDYLP